MGLDMYLKRTKRVEGFTPQSYSIAEETLPWNAEEHTPLKEAVAELLKKKEEEGCDVEDINVENVEELEEVITVQGTPGRFQYKTIYEEVGYWRKANQIHAWFVEKCQDGVDECQLTEVSKEQLENLLQDCYAIVRKKSSPEETLPTQSGFFFGGTNYDEYYMQDIKQTIGILEKTINTTDWDNQIVFYRSSW